MPSPSVSFGAEAGRQTAPDLAVLIPVHNRPERLRRSVASLREQGVGFDIVIVDDGSQPPLTAPAHPGEGEVHLLRQDSNQGIVAALNRGLSFIAEHGHPFVARLDAGDEALPGRLERQLDFLRAHPDHALVGSHVRYVDADGHALGTLKLPTEHDDVRRRIHYRACFYHPAVMLRGDAVAAVGGYRQGFPYAEDYDLFLRLLVRYRGANLDEVLTEVEHTPESATSRHHRVQVLSILRLLLRRFDPALPESYLGVAKQVAVVLLPAELVFRAKRALWSGMTKPVRR